MITNSNNLRELPKGWKWTVLDEACGIILGQSPPSSTYNENGDGLPFYQGKLEFGEMYPTPRKWCSAPKKIAERGDVLLSVRAPVGPTNICPSMACIGRGLAAIRGLGGIKGLFILYLMRAFEPRLTGEGTGTTFKAVTGNQLRSFSIPLAPLPEQKRIVAKIEELFTKLDAGVEGLKKVRQELKRYRQAVLKAAFEGKLTAEWRERNKDKLEPASKLLERITKERERTTKGKTKKLPPLDISNLPELPEGWEWARIGLITDALGGYAFKSKDYTSGGYQIVKIGNVKAEGLDLSVKPCFIRPEDKLIINKYLLKTNDIVITLTGTRRKRDYGFVGIIKDEEMLLLNQRVARLRLYPALLPKYILFAMRTKTFRDWFFESETGNVGQGNVGMGAVINSPIQFTPLQEQSIIVEEIERHFSIADQIEQTIEQGLKQSDRLRQSILKRAFEGKLVPQDPADEPAEKLLERIKAEKANQKTKKITS